MKIHLSQYELPKSGLAVILIDDSLKLPKILDHKDFKDAAKKALAASKNFKGKKGQMISFYPHGSSKLDKVLLVSVGKAAEVNAEVVQSIGGKIVAQLNAMELDSACILIDENKSIKMPLKDIFYHLAMGARLKNYNYDNYFVDKKAEHKIFVKGLGFHFKDADKCKATLAEVNSIVDGVFFTRDLVTTPPNVLYPETFATECKKLSKLGVKVKIMGEKELKKLGMNALLGVSQGSIREPRVVVMEWLGSKNKKATPVAFIGKGVTFDSGGISIKPSANMGDMKYDMGGAGTVTGLMHTLASRKAKVNAIGVIGIVENMPSGSAQRPSDVVVSMSGQTIEVDNTDAEGRLVLSDVLWYTQKTYKPKFMINLATLTGAIVIALGENCYAGLFSNNDDLAKKLEKSAEKSLEGVWRLPLKDFYDKQIDSVIADVRNTGNGRGAGSITAAQFLQRFVNKFPWAHLDIAGMAWDKAGTDTCPKGATGYGVRLLNQLVVDFYED
ncbi:MAG: leucyl aminopeptidase [Rickettsiales bacterium]